MTSETTGVPIHPGGALRRNTARNPVRTTRTHTPAPQNLVFNRPCQLHDFGYSNVGSGLLAKTTYHSAKNRKFVDQRFKDEMYAICKDPRAFLVVGGDYLKCRAVAYGMWKAVRTANPEW